jgi:hypothetical protein
MSSYLDMHLFKPSPWGKKDAQEARERSVPMAVPMEPLDDFAPPPEPAVAVDEPAVAVALDEPVAVEPADEPAGEPAGVPAGALRPRPPKATTPAAGTVPAAAVDLTAGGNRKRNRQSRGTGAPKGRPRADAAADKAADKADKAADKAATAVSKLQQDSKLLREENARLARGALLGVHLNTGPQPQPQP